MRPPNVAVATLLLVALAAAGDADEPRLQFLCGRNYALYSAYFDSRAERPVCANADCTQSHASPDLMGVPMLRLIVMGAGTSWSIAQHNAWSCVLSNPRSARAAPVVLPGKLMPMREGHGKRWNGALLSCPLPRWMKWEPSMRAALRLNSFAVDPAECGAEPTLPVQTPLIRVEHVNDAPPAQSTIAVCLRPLYGDFDVERLAKLVEWLEISRAADVSEIIMYDNVSVVTEDGASSDHALSRLLAPWIAEGFVTMLPWHEPFSCGHNCGVWSAGQTTAHNDCMYRLMNRHRWVAFIDVDEYIWSRAEKKLPVIARALSQEVVPSDTRTSGSVASFVLPHYYMCDSSSDAKQALHQKEARQPGEGLSRGALLRMLDVPNNERVMAKEGHKKNIVNPRLVLEMGIHVPHIFTGALVYVPEARMNETASVSSVWLHHYRRGVSKKMCAASTDAPDRSMRLVMPLVVEHILTKLRAMLASPPIRALLVDKYYYPSTGAAGDAKHHLLQSLRGADQRSEGAHAMASVFRARIEALSDVEDGVLALGGVLCIAVSAFLCCHRFARRMERSRLRAKKIGRLER